MDSKVVPAFYRAWVANTLQGRRHDPELIKHLSIVRDDHAEMASFQEKFLERYDQDGLRDGREEIVETIKFTRDHCRRVADGVTDIINALSTFEA